MVMPASVVKKVAADAGGGATTLAARALGDFLRRMRSRPALAVAGAVRRRVTGLRREEVAVAAGISITWYTWLEQGRPVRTSRRTVRAIARALRLGEAEAAHLSRLAEAVATAAPRWRRTAQASPALRAMVDGLGDAPAYVVNGRWDVLHANAAARAALGPFDPIPGVTDNVLVRLFLDPGWRSRFLDWEAVASSAVAQFRAGGGRLVAHPDWNAFVADLAARSPEFARAWEAHALADPHLRRKRLAGPGGEPLELLYASFAPEGEPEDVRVVLYVPADEAARAALARGITASRSRAARPRRSPRR
ncbi:hypothetical protein PSR1_00479 [Anaeromyxobacter sp. PSR-1]|nr:hypothetical protein PSR1_00479 [Anaeromyxobacter sp. PSR-1]